MRNNAAYLPESPIVYIILPKSIRNRASFRIFDFELSPSEIEIITGLNRNQRAYEQNDPDNFPW